MLSFLYIPINSKEKAMEIADSLVKSKLAACVNIIDNITSIYEWEDNIEHSAELVVLVKTKKELVESAREHITNLHHYDVPCIAEIGISSINKPFAEWVEKQIS